MGIFKALKDDIAAKLGSAKEQIKESDSYQEMKVTNDTVKRVSGVYGTMLKEAAKSAANSYRDVKSGVLKSVAKEISGSMPSLSKELRKKATETDKAIRNSESKPFGEL